MTEINKEFINYVLNLNINGENEKSEDYFSNLSIYQLILEAKMLIDRWNYITNFFIFPISLKSLIISKLSENKYFNENNTIWGANIIFSYDCPADKGIAVSTTRYTPLHMLSSKNVAVFPLNN